MPELLTPVASKEQKTNTAVADGGGRRDKVQPEARIRATMSSGVPTVTVGLRSINVTLDIASPHRNRPFLPHGQERSAVAIVAIS